jgi:hypothetical protein
MATRLLELLGLEVEEEGSDLPSLRVEAPLYRRGPGYKLGGRLPGCRLLRGRGLDVAPPSSGSHTGNFIKCLFPLDQHLRGISPPLCLGSFHGGGSRPLILVEAERGWRHACLPRLSILLGPGRFWQSGRWRSFVVFAGSGSPR